jgi:general secretion pathway protein N
MDWRRAMVCLGLAAALALAAGAARAAVGDAPALDTLPNAADLFPGRMAPGALAPERRASGNPLWAIPLSSLSATRDRPIFVPSRRPPAPVIAGPLQIVPPPPAAAPEPPKLTLVGAAVGEAGGIAVFVDSSNEAIRLRTGQDYAGWVLNSVKGREAIFEKDGETAVFVLPVTGAPSAAAPPVPAPGMPVVPAPQGASAGVVRPSTVGSFAPFIPRSTPKNGESDGL